LGKLPKTVDMYGNLLSLFYRCVWSWSAARTSCPRYRWLTPARKTANIWPRPNTVRPQLQRYPPISTTFFKGFTETINVSTDRLKCPTKLREFTLRHNDNVIWANQKTESFEYHWLRALAIFNVTSFSATLSCNGHHFKFCRYVNVQKAWISQLSSRPITHMQV